MTPLLRVHEALRARENRDTFAHAYRYEQRNICALRVLSLDAGRVHCLTLQAKLPITCTNSP